MKAASLLFGATVLIAAGCGDSSGIPPHSPEETKAINEIKNETPQQQIDRIQKGPMPESAKASMIQQIKDKNGIK